MALLRLKVPAVVALLIVHAIYVDASAEMVKNVAKGFSTVLVECGKEEGLTDEALNEIYNFWNADFQLTNRAVGCAIICMAKKHGIVMENGRIHHESGAEFAKKHGADEGVAKKLVQIIHECEDTHVTVGGDCERVLEIAKCFRAQCKKLNWMPNFQELVDEVMG